MNNSDKTELLTTQEFALLCGVTKATLHHYDSLNILKPVVRGENGYRYYAKAQIYDYEIILALKDLGTPLAEIREYLGRKNADGFLALLRKKQLDLEKQLRKTEQQRRYLENSISMTEYALKAECDVVEFKDCLEEYYTAFFVQDGANASSKSSLLQLRDYLTYKSETLQYDTFSWGHIVMYAELQKNDFSVRCFCGRLDKPGDEKYLFIKPPGTYAVLNRKGKYTQINEAIQFMCREIEQNGYHICGNMYTENALCYLMEARQDHYMYKISIQVERISK